MHLCILQSRTNLALVILWETSGVELKLNKFRREIRLKTHSLVYLLFMLPCVTDVYGLSPSQTGQPIIKGIETDRVNLIPSLCLEVV